jgi:hypothetical protein
MTAGLRGFSHSHALAPVLVENDAMTVAVHEVFSLEVVISRCSMGFQ